MKDDKSLENASKISQWKHLLEAIRPAFWKRRIKKKYENGHIFEKWQANSLQSYLYAVHDFSAMEVKEAKFELYRDSTRALSEELRIHLILSHDLLII